MMKRVHKVLLSFLLGTAVLNGCAGKSESADPLDGTYYCQRVMVYDQNQNLQDFYNSEVLGAENTVLKITGGESVEFTYYYHGEVEKELKGSLRDKAETDGYTTGKVLFEGDAAEYTLSYETDKETGKPSKLALVSAFGENGNYLGFSLAGEKRTAVTGPYEDLEDKVSKLNDFASSKTYTDIKNVIDQTFADFEHTLEYDQDVHTLTLSIYMDGLKDALDRSREVAGSFDELCTSLDNIASSVQTAINAGGYKGVNFIVEFSDGAAVLYHAEKGSRVSAYKPSESTAAAPAKTPASTPSGSSSFEDFAVYKEIRQQMVSSFPDSDPKVSFRKKDNMLTVTLTGGKNWEDAVLNDTNSYLAWLDYTANLNNVSASGYNVLCDAGYSDVAFTIMVVSYSDPSKALYACMNGEGYYDFTEK